MDERFKQVVFNVRVMDDDPRNREIVYGLVDDYTNHLSVQSGQIRARKYKNCVVVSSSMRGECEMMLVLDTSKLDSLKSVQLAGSVLGGLKCKGIKRELERFDIDFFDYAQFLSDKAAIFTLNIRQAMISSIINDDCVGYVYMDKETRNKIANNEYAAPSLEQIKTAYLNAINEEPTPREEMAGLNCFIKGKNNDAVAPVGGENGAQNANGGSVDKQKQEFIKQRGDCLHCIPPVKPAKVARSDCDVQSSLQDFFDASK